MYYQWHKKKKEIMALSKTKKRCSGAETPPALAELENIYKALLMRMNTDMLIII